MNPYDWSRREWLKASLKTAAAVGSVAANDDASRIVTIASLTFRPNAAIV